MRIGLMTDAACDLPAQFFQQNNVAVLPINLHFGDRDALDIREVSLALEFYRSYVGNKNLDVETSPLDVKQTVNIFRSLASKYDKVICIVITRNRSKIYENATKASYVVLKELHGTDDGTRAPAASEPFAVRVVDSDALFCGQGIVVYDAWRRIQEGVSYGTVINHVTQIAQHVHGFLVPQDLYYLRSRAKKRNEKTVGVMKYVLGNALNVKPIIEGHRGQTLAAAKGRGFEATVQMLFDKTMEKIEEGLRVPAVAMAYGGDPKHVTNMPGYKRFVEMAKPRGIKILVSVMSPTAGIYVGPDAFNLAFAAGGADDDFIFSA